MSKCLSALSETANIYLLAFIVALAGYANAEPTSKQELDKLNASEAASINDYVRNNGHLTEQQADQIVHNQTHFQSQRAALLDKYYDKFKAALGPASAARFIEAENQLLSLTDLQLSSALPVE